MQRSDVLQALDSVLEPWRFKDYCPNGLQVEGRADIRRIVTGVTASAALIDAAIALQADAILVHHGYFWKNEDPRVLGMKKSRLAQFLFNIFHVRTGGGRKQAGINTVQIIQGSLRTLQLSLNLFLRPFIFIVTFVIMLGIGGGIQIRVKADL